MGVCSTARRIEIGRTRWLDATVKTKIMQRDKKNGHEKKKEEEKRMLDATKLRKWLNSIIIFVGFEIGLFSCLDVTRLDRPSSGKSFVRFEVQKHGMCGEWAGRLQKKIARGPERPFFPNSIPVRKFAIERKTRVTLNESIIIPLARLFEHCSETKKGHVINIR